MSTTEIAMIEKTLAPLAPRFADVLARSGITPERLIRTVVISVERLPALLDCTRQSIINAAMSAAVLGLEVDGVTGQAYLIPFAGQAQLVIGYKGYNTLAARSGYTINGEVVREGDDFEFALGTGGFIRHRPKLGGDGRIIAAWAIATSLDRPPIIGTPLSVKDINAVKDRSPGAKKSSSPWNDPIIGYPAMAAKTAKRRLARAMPMNIMQLAARMDEAHEEQGAHAFIDARGALVVEGEVLPIVAKDAPVILAPRYIVLGSDGREVEKPTFEQWQLAWAQALQRMPSVERLNAFLDRHKPILDALRGNHRDEIDRIERAAIELREAFAGGV